MTIVSIVAFLFGLLYLVLSKRGMSSLSPYPQVCLSYMIWFARPLDSSVANTRVEVVNILGLVVFSVAYIWVERSRLTLRLANRMIAAAASARNGCPKPLRSSLSNLFCVLSASATGVVVLANAYYFGSLTGSLTRFRSGIGVEEVPSWIRSGEGFVISGVLVLTMVTYIDCLIHKRLVQLWRLVILGLCYLALTIPTGTGGYLINLGIGLVICEMISHAIVIRRVRASMRSVVLLVVCGALSLMLLFIREKEFSGLGDVIGFIGDESRTIAADIGQIGKEYQAGMNVWIFTALETYRDESEFLWGYTFYSIAVNWVPRTLWQEKPVGLGRLIVSENPHDPIQAAYSKVMFSVALGLAGEGWVNGGYVGIVGLGLLTGALCGLLGACFTRSLESGQYYPLALGLLARLAATNFVRGDWLSAWSAFVFPLICLFAVTVLLRYLKRMRKSIGGRRGGVFAVC
jgi:hypothetical protein